MADNTNNEKDQALAHQSQDVNDFMFKMMSSPNLMDEQLAYLIWGSVVTTTRAYESVTININVEIQRIFVSVRLRWWARFKKFDVIKGFWLKRAQERAAKYIPNGWRLLVYYERGNENTAGRYHGPQDQTRAGATAGANRLDGDGDRDDEAEQDGDE